MNFNKIRGHRGVLSLLGKMVEEDDTRGTFLFSGPRSVGKHLVAKTFSKYISCIGTRDDSCRCLSCRVFPNSPDILFIEPAGASIKIAQIREIEEFLSLAPYKAKSRVVVIDDADLMTYSSANAILKVAEEPLSNSTIILVTGHQDRILPTILSRAEHFEFGGLSEQDYLDIMSDLGHTKANLKDRVPLIGKFSGNFISGHSSQSDALDDGLSFLKKVNKVEDDDIISLVNLKDDLGILQQFSEALVLCLSDIYRFKKLGADGILLKNKWELLSVLDKDWSEEECLVGIDQIRNALDSVDNTLNLKLKPRVIVSLLMLREFLKKKSKT